MEFTTDRFYPATPHEEVPVMTPADVLADEQQFGGTGHNLRLSLHGGLGGWYKDQDAALEQSYSVLGRALGVAVDESTDEGRLDTAASAFYSGAVLALRSELTTADDETSDVVLGSRILGTGSGDATPRSQLEVLGGQMSEKLDNLRLERSEQLVETLTALGEMATYFVDDYLDDELAAQHSKVLRFGYLYGSRKVNRIKQHRAGSFPGPVGPKR